MQATSVAHPLQIRGVLQANLSQSYCHVRNRTNIQVEQSHAHVLKSYKPMFHRRIYLTAVAWHKILPATQAIARAHCYHKIFPEFDSKKLVPSLKRRFEAKYVTLGFKNEKV